MGQETQHQPLGFDQQNEVEVDPVVQPLRNVTSLPPMLNFNRRTLVTPAPSRQASGV